MKTGIVTSWQLLSIKRRMNDSCWIARQSIHDLIDSFALNMGSNLLTKCVQCIAGTFLQEWFRMISRVVWLSFAIFNVRQECFGLIGCTCNVIVVIDCTFKPYNTSTIGRTLLTPCFGENILTTWQILLLEKRLLGSRGACGFGPFRSM